MREILFEQRDGVFRVPGPASMAGLDYTEIAALIAALALKLDASAYTAADVLAKLLTVDGAGSGIDADLLDGQSSAAFLSAASYTAADVLAKLLTVDGTGSGLDADLLDGQSSAAFLLAASYTAADVLTKLLTVDGAGSGLDADLLDGISSAGFVAVGSYTAADVLTKLLTVDGSGSGLDADLLDGISSAGFVAVGSYTAADVLTKLLTVDGAGSGLDADLLDGISSAGFLQTSTYQALAPTWSAQHIYSLAGNLATPTILMTSTQPVLMWDETDSLTNADERKWAEAPVTKVMQRRSVSDSGGASIIYESITRGTGTAISDMRWGDATNNNTYTFNSSGTATFSGALSAPVSVTSGRFIPNNSTVPANGLYLPSGNNPALSANSTKVIEWTSTLVTITGNLSLGTAGNKLLIKEGTNASMGVATLVLGTVVVNTTVVTATSRIQLTAQSLGTVTVPSALAVSARTAGTSFTILASQLTDTSVVAWQITEPA